MRAALAFSRDGGRERVVLDTDRERLNPDYRLSLSFDFQECEAYGPVDYRCPAFMEIRLANT